MKLFFSAMPRLINLQWFEEISFIYEPFFDTPLGKLTVRQMSILGFFAVLAYGVSTLASDTTGKALLGGTVLVVGLALALQRVKTVPPERSILLMLSMPKPRKPKAASGKEDAEKKTDRLEAESLRIPVEDITSIPRVSVAGFLADPHTGRVLSRRGFQVFIGDEKVSEGVSKPDGSFAVYLKPSGYGQFELKIVPEGFSDAVQTIPVLIEPKGDGRVRRMRG